MAEVGDVVEVVGDDVDVDVVFFRISWIQKDYVIISAVEMWRQI